MNRLCFCGSGRKAVWKDETTIICMCHLMASDPEILRLNEEAKRRNETKKNEA